MLVVSACSPELGERLRVAASRRPAVERLGCPAQMAAPSLCELGPSSASRRCPTLADILSRNTRPLVDDATVAGPGGCPRAVPRNNRDNASALSPRMWCETNDRAARRAHTRVACDTRKHSAGAYMSCMYTYTYMYIYSYVHRAIKLFGLILLEFIT
jgi:hypothetical protein